MHDLDPIFLFSNSVPKMLSNGIWYDYICKKFIFGPNYAKFYFGLNYLLIMRLTHQITQLVCSSQIQYPKCFPTVYCTTISTERLFLALIMHYLCDNSLIIHNPDPILFSSLRIVITKVQESLILVFESISQPRTLPTNFNGENKYELKCNNICKSNKN